MDCGTSASSAWSPAAISESPPAPITTTAGLGAIARGICETGCPAFSASTNSRRPGARHPELQVSTPAHTKRSGRHVDVGSRGGGAPQVESARWAAAQWQVHRSWLRHRPDAALTGSHSVELSAFSEPSRAARLVSWGSTPAHRGDIGSCARRVGQRCGGVALAAGARTAAACSLVRRDADR